MEHDVDQRLAAAIPMRRVGPLRFAGGDIEGEVTVPLATFESPLWPSVERGAAATARGGGIAARVLDERMCRSVAFEARDLAGAADAARFVEESRDELAGVAAGTSRFARLLEVRAEVVGRLVFARFAFATGDASGHNMATKAADAMLGWILERRGDCRYVSVSGNTCCDKKVSAVNGILGRGKRVVAEAFVPRRLVRRFLHAEAEDIERLAWRKNWVGSALAGSLRSANAHFANMLLAFYLATGQDAANIVEGSQGFALAEAEAEGLRFSCTLPNVIVGTVGNGKGLDWVRENLEAMGCAEEGAAPGANARRLACICGGVVLCGELSLLAALSNPGELVEAHMRLERGGGRG